MAEILVKNSLNNNLTVKMDVNLHKFSLKGSSDNSVWMLGVATTAPSLSGLSIPPEYVNLTDGFNTVDSALTGGVSKIAANIDWGELSDDNESPYVVSNLPESDNTVSIESNVYIDIKDDVPSAGIDLTDLTVKINTGTSEFDVTDKCLIEGNPFCYQIKWSPPARNYCVYDRR